MTIEFVNYKGKTVIALSGDIDMYSSPDLRKELMTLIKKKANSLLIDFKDVSYIDSSGIATFVESLKYMKSYGGRLRLFCVPDGIIEIFRFSKLDRVFEIYGSIDDAIES
jgi:anti-sigma B factor antagonist